MMVMVVVVMVMVIVVMVVVEMVMVMAMSSDDGFQMACGDGFYWWLLMIVMAFGCGDGACV